MPVNGFSFLSEKFFVVLPSNSHSIELACSVLRRKNQERRRLAGGSIQNATNGVRGNRLIQDGGGILRYAFGIVRKHPRHCVLVENRARLLEISGKKKPRAVLDAAKTFVRASRH